MKYLYISKTPYLSSLNRNIGCIETIIIKKLIQIILILNRNIGCIETMVQIIIKTVVIYLNRNIGCIETLLSSCDSFIKASLEPKHRMYWNSSPSSGVKAYINFHLEPKHRMYWNLYIMMQPKINSPHLNRNIGCIGY